MVRPLRLGMLAAGILLAVVAVDATAQEARRLVLPEQRCLEIRDPSQIPRARLPRCAPPLTLDDTRATEPPWALSLDDAICTALANADVVRVLAGTTAVASGATIYDPAIRNTQIDQNRARFDPTFQSSNTFSRLDQPYGSILNPGPPPTVGILGNPTQGFRSSTGLSKPLITGGTVGVDINADHQQVDALGRPLNPQLGSDVTLRMNQPILKGAGATANMAAILIARINTERSFFQLKDSVQDLVLSVTQTYWNLSFAQIEVWARRQQVEQGREALERAEAQAQAGLGDSGDVAQARVSYDNYRATLVTAEANLLDQEAVLRNLLGISPSDRRRIHLTSSPITVRLPASWNEILGLAEQYRPDLIELKLILEADQQQLALSKNQALPQLDLGALYRWNGLEGTTPNGDRLGSDGRFADWEMGVNFSVPLGLRRERAAVRESELTIMRDRVNLQQALHSTSHALAGNFRNLAQYHAQYEAYHRVREAARLNLEQQMADYLSGRRTLYLNVLQALNDWGNAVRAEYLALTQYNSELARLERATGTILESHGIRFVEERYRSIGMLGRLGPQECYPRDMRPGPNVARPIPPEEMKYRMPEPIRVPIEDEPQPDPRRKPGDPIPSPDATPIGRLPLMMR